MASENFLISQKHVWNETSHLLILMYCVWILAIRRDTQDIQWNVATCREAANVCNERMKHRFLPSSLQLGGRKLCLRNRSHGSPQWWTMPRRQWINAIRWDSVLKALSTTEAKKNPRFTQVTSVVDNALKTKKDTTSSKHCPTRRQKTSSACSESNANSFQGIWMEDSFIQMPCKELALLQLTDATNVQPCTAGTPKKKGACRRLAWLQRQTGFWTEQKDASTNHKQLTSKLLSCELLIVCTCKLLLQSSKIFRRTWTLHLCPVGATADCESVHRSCPRCGSKIHSQQVSVLGHQSAVV